MLPNGPHIGYCAVHCITSIIQHNSFLNKLFKNFEEQVEDFCNVASASLVKKVVIQLKSIKAIKLKNYNVLNAPVIPKL